MYWNAGMVRCYSNEIVTSGRIRWARFAIVRCCLKPLTLPLWKCSQGLTVCIANSGQRIPLTHVRLKNSADDHIWDSFNVSGGKKTSSGRRYFFSKVQVGRWISHRTFCRKSLSEYGRFLTPHSLATCKISCDSDCYHPFFVNYFYYLF